MYIKKDWNVEKESLHQLHLELTGSSNNLPHDSWPFSFSYEHLYKNPKMEKFLSELKKAYEIKEKAEDQLLLKLWNLLPKDSPLKGLGSEKFYSFWNRLNRDPIQLAVVDSELDIVHSMILADHFSAHGFNPKSDRFHVYKDHVNWIMQGSDQRYLELWSKDFIKCKNHAKKPDHDLLKIISTFQSICINWDGSSLEDCPGAKNVMKEVLQENREELENFLNSNDEYGWQKKIKTASNFVPIIY